MIVGSVPKTLGPAIAIWFACNGLCIPTAASDNGYTLPTPNVTADELEQIPTGNQQPRGPVLGVEIVGNKHISKTEIQRHIKTRPDRSYDSQLVQEDVRRLYATRKFHTVRPRKKVVAQGVYVTFEVVERPTIGEVLFIGNRYMSDKTLARESGLKKGEALNIYAIQEARRKIEEHYQSKGYVKTQVSILEGNKPNDHRVVLRVDEGRVQRIWKVQFEGNDPSLATDARLKTKISSKPGFAKYLFGGKVDYSVIDEDIKKLTLYYKNLGYLKAVVGREIESDDSEQWITLTFVINQGPRYRLRNISIAGNTLFDSDAILERMELASGDYYNQERLLKDEKTLRDLYGGHGHIFADISASPIMDEEPGVVDLVYRVEEGGLFCVGEIKFDVAGEFPQTRKSVIMNRLSFRPGDIIDIREVRASERRLKASQLFVTNPAEGAPPQIVIRPPNLAEMESLARNKRGTYRGQSPDASKGRHTARKMILEVITPRLKN